LHRQGFRTYTEQLIAQISTGDNEIAKSKNIQASMKTKEDIQVFVEDMCPVETFKTVLKYLLTAEGLLKNVTPPVTLANTMQRYKNLTKEEPMCNYSKSTWPYKSGKPLIMDLGLGTTGTRWLTTSMRGRCHAVGHNIQDPARGSSLRCSSPTNCMAIVDRFDFIADSPIPYIAVPLLLSFPNSYAINTLRDPVSWIKSRLSGTHENINGAAETLAPGPCGHTRNPLGVYVGLEVDNIHIRERNKVVVNPAAAVDVMVFQTFVTCISQEMCSPNRFLTINVFRENDMTIDSKIDQFLELHGLSKPKCNSVTKRTMSAVVVDEAIRATRLASKANKEDKNLRHAVSTLKTLKHTLN